jgi:hypothetical protein
VLTTPNDGIMRVTERPDWLAMRLTRPSTVGIVWRWNSDAPPSWLRNWTVGANVSINGETFGTYTRRVGAGDLALGGVYDGDGGSHLFGRDTYWVLVGEADGSPTGAPPTPAGREVAQPNQTCPSWVHEQYVATGPDGRTYPTWHPQIDPVYWCYFRHEHGSDPALFSPKYQPVYGYAAAAMGDNEPHPGFKSYVFDDGLAHRWLITHHFGTGSIDRVCTRYHTVDIAVIGTGTQELLADMHFMADFGKAVSNLFGSAPLAPRACPNQAAQADADGSVGGRAIPTANPESGGYEAWRLDASQVGLGVQGEVTFNTLNQSTTCDTLECSVAVPTGKDGSSRVLKTGKEFGISAASTAGAFYTNAKGGVLMSEGQPGAVRQYVRPGFSTTVPYIGDRALCVSSGPWGDMYECDDMAAPSMPPALEGALLGPN